MVAPTTVVGLATTAIRQESKRDGSIRPSRSHSIFISMQYTWRPRNLGHAILMSSVFLKPFSLFLYFPSSCLRTVRRQYIRENGKRRNYDAKDNERKGDKKRQVARRGMRNGDRMAK